MNLDGILTKVFRSVDEEVYEEAARRFLKFKGLVYGKMDSEDWCWRNGVQIVQEILEIEPAEVFFIAWRLSDSRPDVPKEILEFVEKVGDRVPVSDEERVYLFPKDLHDKIVMFGATPS